MADSVVSVSLAIVRLHDLLHKYKDVINNPDLTDQISDSISKVQRILSSSVRGERTYEHSRKLLHLNHKAAEMEKWLSTFQKDHFAKVFALVPFSSVRNQGRSWENMAKDFMTTVASLSGEHAPSRPPVQEGLPDNKGASSSSSSKTNGENTSVESRPPVQEGLPDDKGASSSSSSETNGENTRVESQPPVQEGLPDDKGASYSSSCETNGENTRVENDIVGREQHVKELLARLINDGDSNLRVISVVGDRSCGKTALVRSVFNKLKIKIHFYCRAWVHAACHGPESSLMKNLLVEILKQTPVRDGPKNLESKEEEQLSEMLHKSLMEHRYLIVLDNWVDAKLFNELLVPFVDSKNGSRVIVTTRKAEMHKFADPWMPHLELLPDLSEKECKDFLRRSITRGGNSIDDGLQSEILSKCCGSPPKISLLGGLLSRVEEGSKQADLIKRLKNHPTLHDVVRLSVDELPNMMKLCALYIALYPEEAEVPTRRLFWQWSAEWLLAEATAEDCLRELEKRNLICVVPRQPDGSARSCRMPTFLHEFFRQKAEEIGLPRIQDESRVMGHDAELSRHVQCLRSLACFNACKLGTEARDIVVLLKSPQDLLKSPLLGGRPCLLRVLDLEGVYKPVLPEDFGNIMLNLRYLGLRWTVLDSIPESVGNLLLLETLDLKHTNITKVTSAIWNSKNLRHLYLSEASFGKSIPRHLTSGKPPNTKLETLWGLYIENDKSPMISALKKLQSLKKLGLTCSPGAVKAVQESVSQLARLESLRVRSRDLLGQPSILTLSGNNLPENLSHLYLLGSLNSIENLSTVLPSTMKLKVLTLSMLGLRGDPMPVLGGLTHLMVLRLLARSCTGKTLCCESGFRELRVLKLWMLDELEILDIKKGAMRNLQELEIRHCKNLENVNGLKLKRIGSLESVSLTGVQQKLADNVRASLADNVRDPQVFVSARELIPEAKSQQEKDEH